MSKQVKSLWHIESSYNIASTRKSRPGIAQAGNIRYRQPSTEAAESQVWGRNLLTHPLPPLGRRTAWRMLMGHLHRCFAYQNRGLYPLRPPSPGNSAAYRHRYGQGGRGTVGAIRRWQSSIQEPYDITKSSHEGKEHLRSWPNVKQEL